MKSILLMPNQTGAGHNNRMLTIGKKIVNTDAKVSVVLSSLKHIFTDMFEDNHINVILKNSKNYAIESNLSQKMNWEKMIQSYFVPTFFNGNEILQYMSLIEDEKVDLIISDYNINATIAAILLDKKNIFVTERHNFTLVDIDIKDLIDAGFQVNIHEISKAKKTLFKLFKWMVNHIDLIITDKVLLKDFATDNYLIGKKEKVVFTGSIYANEKDSQPINLSNYKIDINKPYIVATLSNTTMIKESRIKAIEFFKKIHKQMKKKDNDIQMIIIGSDLKNSNENNFITIPYIPNWRYLIENSTLLISHPGWITVTEVSYLKIPTIFYLPDFKEYHEVEAYKRLEYLNIPVFSGYNNEAFSKLANEVINKKNKFFEGYKILCPDNNGLQKTVELINEEIGKC